MTAALIIGTFAVDDVRDVSEEHTKPVSVTESITGSKIVQYGNSLSCTGNSLSCTGKTLSYAARMLPSDYEFLKYELKSGGYDVSVYSLDKLIWQYNNAAEYGTEHPWVWNPANPYADFAGFAYGYREADGYCRVISRY